MKQFTYISVVVLTLCLFSSCNEATEVSKVKSPFPAVDTVEVKSEEIIKPDCSVLLNSKEIGLPMEDTLGIYGNELSRTQFFQLRLNTVVQYDSTMRYSLLGKISRKNFVLALVSYSSGGEGGHWLLAYDTKNCVLIDKEQTVYGDEVEYYRETRSRILEQEFRVTERVYDYSGPKEKMKKTVKVFKFADNGKFIRG